MPKHQQYDFFDFSGGRNGGAPRTGLADNECAEILNFYPHGRKLKRRGGQTILNRLDSPYYEGITSLFSYADESDLVTLFALATGSIGRVLGPIIVAVTALDGTVIAQSPSALWDSAQYKQFGYLGRRNLPRLLRLSPDGYMKAGIERPGSAATLADGGAASLPAGDYIGVVTFINLATGAESDPSDDSNTLTLAANRQIAWTAIPTSTNPQVTGRRLYRTTANQRGEYFLVTTIEDNSTTTFTDNVGIDALGNAASFRNGLPPANPRQVEVHAERLWLTDGDFVYFSEPFLPESFHSANVVNDFSPDDGHKIRALHKFGDRLVVGKTNKVYAVTGTNEGDFGVQTISDAAGCMAGQSMKSVEGLLIWFGGDNFYRSDGINTEPIGDIKIRDVVDAIPKADWNDISAAIIPEKNWYVALVSQGQTRIALVYNYRTGSWVKFTEATGSAPTYITEFFIENRERVIYATHKEAGYVIHYDDPAATSDYGTVIPGFVYHRGVENRRRGAGISMSKVGLEISNVPQQASLNVLHDGEIAPAASRTVDLYDAGGDDFRWWDLSSLREEPAADVEFVLVYSGADAIELSGISLDVVEFEGETGVR